MSRADYAHWNEEQDLVWWQEEGRHHGSEEPSDPDPGSRYDDWDEDYRCLDIPKECMAAGNFNKATNDDSEADDDLWVCDGCDTLFRLTPEEKFIPA